MAYASTEKVEAGFRVLSESEKAVCRALLDEAAVIIDSVAENAPVTAKCLVSCRMVRRAIGDAGLIPMGATQGTTSALGYSQSVTFGSNGSSGELYISRLEKSLLRRGNRIGFASPLGGDCDD